MSNFAEAMQIVVSISCSNLTVAAPAVIFRHTENDHSLDIFSFMDHCLQQFQSSSSDTKNNATFKVTSITFPPSSEAQFELQQVAITISTCLSAMSHYHYEWLYQVEPKGGPKNQTQKNNV